MFICPGSASGCNPDSDWTKSWGGKVMFGCPPDYVPENRFLPAQCPPWYWVSAQLCVNKTQPPLHGNLPVRQKFLSVDSYLLCPSSFFWTCWFCGQVDIGTWVIQTNQFQVVKNIHNNISTRSRWSVRLREHCSLEKGHRNKPLLTPPNSWYYLSTVYKTSGGR